MSYLERCNEDQLKQVYEEFGATEETVQRDVQTLKEWLEQQPHLPNVKGNGIIFTIKEKVKNLEDDEMLYDSFLRLFLVRCKISLERAKQTLEMYYISKAYSPQLFINRDPTSAEFKNMSNKVAYSFLVPKLTPELNRVLVSRFCENLSNSELPSVDAFARLIVTSGTLANVVSGVHKKFICVLDCSNITASMIPLIMSNIRKVYSLVLEHSPVRIEAIYLLMNSSSTLLIDPILVILRKMSEKTFGDRLIMWKKNKEDLVEVISKESLPNEYGGTAGSCNELRESYLKELESWKGWVDEENKYVADLTKVPEDHKKKLDMGEFGVEGSFRKLGVD